MSGNYQIECMDVHMESPPCGGCVPATHRFASKPRGTCEFVGIDDGNPLREGDKYANEAVPDHSVPATGGQFVCDPEAEGEFVSAGQSLVQIDGRPCMTLNGMLKVCSDGVTDHKLSEAGLLSGEPLVVIDGAVVVTGD